MVLLLSFQKEDGCLILQTSIPMFGFLPDNYPLTVCLVDCTYDNLYQLQSDLHILPTLVYAVNPKKFYESSTRTKNDVQQVLGSATLQANCEEP